MVIAFLDQRGIALGTPATEQAMDTRVLRQAFGSFTTGVTVVTTMRADGSPVGFTANSFTSVSLDPPLLLVCLARQSSSIDTFSQSRAFAVNVLSDAQRDVSGRFASRVEDRFAETQWRKTERGCPVIDDVVAWFDCETANVIDAGDHVILMGQVAAFDHTEHRPLAYLRGHYLDLQLGEAAADQVSATGGVRVGSILENSGQVLLQHDEAGWGLPMGMQGATLREGRRNLNVTLAASGVAAEMGFPYSIFDAPSGDATWMVFHGHADQCPQNETLRLFVVDDLPLQDIAIPQVRSILRRFQSETKDARFGLYVDEARTSGKVVDIHRTPQKFETYTRSPRAPEFLG